MQLLQELFQWSSPPGPPLQYREADLVASDILAADTQLLWEPHITLAAKVQQLIGGREQQIHRCKEKVAICKREGNDSVSFFQHYGSECQATSQAGIDTRLPLPAPWDSIQPGAADMWAIRKQVGVRAIVAAAQLRFSSLLSEARKLTTLFAGCTTHPALLACRNKFYSSCTPSNDSSGKKWCQFKDGANSKMVPIQSHTASGYDSNEEQDGEKCDDDDDDDEQAAAVANNSSLLKLADLVLAFGDTADQA
jgi:hypothetical protein